LVAIVVLIVDYIRHNPRRHERAPQLDPGAGAGAGHWYYLFGAAGLSPVRFVGLILAPALAPTGAPGRRSWRDSFLFVLAALVLIGLVIGIVVFLNWDKISNWL
jgi:hypothetical protein